MEFWRIYRLVMARRWLIIGLMVITLLTVFVCKVAIIDANKQFVANAVVLPSPKAMKPNGLYADDKTSVLSPTYDRFSRLALFVQSIKSHAQAEVIGTSVQPGLITEPTITQKEEVVRALSNQMESDARAQIEATIKSTKISNADKERYYDTILKSYGVPTDHSFWEPQTSLNDAEKQQIASDLDAAPLVSTEVNQTPGATNPTPTITDYLGITVHATDPKLAQQIANLTAAKFVNAYYNDGKMEYRNSLIEFQDNQAEAITKLNKAQNKLLDFEKRTGFSNLPLQEAARVTNLERMTQQRDAAQVQLEAAQRSVAAYDQIARENAPQYSIPLNPLSRPEARQLQAEVLNAQADLEAAQARYTPDMPLYKRAEAALKAKKKEYDEFLKKPFVASQVNPLYFHIKDLRGRAQEEVARAQATVITLDGQIQRLQKQNSSTLPEAQKTLSALQVSYDTARLNKKVADQALENLKLTSKSLDNGLITLANAANFAVPDANGPGLTALLIYAAILSLVFGIAAVLGLDYLDNTVQTIPDAEKLLGMPISAVIPAMPPGDPRRQARLTLSDPLSPIAESYRLLRTDLLFTAEDKPFKSLMAATAKPGQGATTTVSNLAVSLAQVGKRVILIDADLRRPRLHELFNVSNEIGLTSLLRGECEMEEALKVTDIDNLLVLPSGPLPLNPSELLASQKMRTLHERLKPHTDFILVDSPSAIAFSDSAILSSFMDAVLLVVRAQEAPRGSEMQVRDMLNKARANVVGVVLNGVKPQLVDSYYYHAAYYPQVTTAVGNGHTGTLPPPSHGNGYERTLEGDTLGDRLPAQAFAGHAAAGDGHGAPRGSEDAQDDIERTVVMDDIVEVKPPQGKSRFSLRSLFGTEDKE